MTVAEAAAAQVRKEQLQRDINSHKVEKVNRVIYSKTEQELAKLYKLKSEWKAKVANGYIVNTVLLAGADTIPLQYKDSKHKLEVLAD